MFAGIRKLNVSPSRLTALALMVVVAITLLNACGGGGGGGDGGGGGGDGGEDSPTMTITPTTPTILRTIATLPAPSSTQKLEVLDDGTHQNMEFDASGVPEFDTLIPTGRTYTARSSAPDVATASIDTDGVATVTAVKRGSADITITVDGVAASTLARSVSAPSIRAVAAYSFTVEVENRAPTLENPIPDKTDAEVGTVFSYVFPANTFNDADDDSLFYTAGKQPDVAWLTFTAATRTFSGTPAVNTAGAITVMVTTTDGNGGSVTDEFTIGVNRPPVAVGKVAALTLTAGRPAATRDVASNFSDPENDSLTYTASLLDSAVATAIVSGSVVTVTPVAIGSATITVTAQDPGGLSATQTIGVTVATNQAPTVVGTVAALTFTLGDSAATRDVASNFSDPENDSLTYTASTLDSAVATAIVSGSVVTVTPVVIGSATITVTAQDPGGLSATQTIAVTVVATNQVPTAVGTVAAVTLTVGDSAATRDVASNFRDPDNDFLTYSASTSATSVAIVHVTNSVVKVTPIEVGSATITVTAQDSGGLNATQSFTVTVNSASGPDLIVLFFSVSASSLVVEESFILSASVLNQGTGAPASTTLRYYRSSDSTISSDDTEEFTRSIRALAYLELDDNNDQVIDAPNSAGTYYYGVCVDSVAGETATNNNCSTGIAVVVSVPASPPDLIVSSFSVSDSSLTTSEFFTLYATVRNQGTGTAAETTLRYHEAGYDAGYDGVLSLAASETSPKSIIVSAPSSAGTYYYHACVTPVAGETVTDNNCSTGVSVVVSEPIEVTEVVSEPIDLLISFFSVNRIRVPAGYDNIYLSATVRNQGTEAAAATTLRYYRSSDSVISSDDTLEDTDSIPALATSATKWRSADRIIAPSLVGTYYYGVCVDSVTDETVTNNNCSTGISVVVFEPPDMIVSTSVSTPSLTRGEPFTLYAMVQNQGGGTVTPFLEYYLSFDSTISSRDTRVAYNYLPAFVSLQTVSRQIVLSAPGLAGTYYYGACVDPVESETDVSNNCSTGVKVVVTSAQIPEASVPDLIVSASSVSDSSLMVGSTFTLNATVRNQGTGTATATTLRYYRIPESNSRGTRVGTNPIVSLAASATSSASIDLPAPDISGTYYYIACVDFVTTETARNNNCSTEIAVMVRSVPDLIVDSLTVSESSLTVEESFRLYATVRNQGTKRVTETLTTLRYYHSSDSTISSSDTPVGTHHVFSLDPLEADSDVNYLTAPSSAGTYYYGACVDSVFFEENTGNNCSTAVAVTVNSAQVPDLIVNSPSVSKSSLAVGGTFTLNATVHNQGTGTAAATTLRYYRSSDSTITRGDTSVSTDTDDVVSLPASATSPQLSISVVPDESETYYYGACVDSVEGETVTSNNCSTGVRVVVVDFIIVLPDPTVPDLIVNSPSVSKSNLAVGGTFTLNTTVHNQGTGTAAATTLRYYRSSDSTITRGDTSVSTDTDDVVSLPASATSPQLVDLGSAG